MRTVGSGSERGVLVLASRRVSSLPVVYSHAHARTGTGALTRARNRSCRRGVARSAAKLEETLPQGVATDRRTEKQIKLKATPILSLLFGVWFLLKTRFLFVFCCFLNASRARKPKGVDTRRIYERSPRMRRASWMSLGMMVTRLAWIAHRLVSSKRPTR